MKASQVGFQLVELIIAVSIIGVFVAVAVPQILNLAAGEQLRLAAAEVSGTLRLCRSHAIRHGTHVAVKFRTDADGRVTYTLYRDGDGDGVRSDDIRTGRDPQLAAPRRLQHFAAGIAFGFPPGIQPRDPSDPGRKLRRLEDPIRFNRSDLASFSPIGTGTPGSVYVTDGRRGLAAVRVFSRTGKVRTLIYLPENGRWRNG